MFALQGTIHNILRNSAKTLLRRNYVRRARPPANAGLAHQLQMLQDPENVDIDDSDLQFEDYESDFSTVGQSYKDFQKDFEKHKDKQRHLIVKRKYFKESNYNFLTWSEKEQIKHLHQSDSVQYSAERLAEIFPASNEVILKILKTNWKIKDPDRILKHDKAVELNWSLLRKGQMDIDQKYKEHLLKFSSRGKLILNENKYFPKEHFQDGTHTFKTSSTEFSSIIQSYNNLKSKGEDSTTEGHDQGKTEKRKPLKETYVMDCAEDDNITSEPMSFSNFEQEVQLRNNNCDEKQSPKKVTNTKKILSTLDENPVQIFGRSFQKNDTLTPDSTRQIANFIKIPPKLWKRGQTYKVDDCFYDDDGRFLYRVPGLISNKN